MMINWSGAAEGLLFGSLFSLFVIWFGYAVDCLLKERICLGVFLMSTWFIALTGLMGATT